MSYMGGMNESEQLRLGKLEREVAELRQIVTELQSRTVGLVRMGPRADGEGSQSLRDRLKDVRND